MTAIGASIPGKAEVDEVLGQKNPILIDVPPEAGFQRRRRLGHTGQKISVSSRAALSGNKIAWAWQHAPKRSRPPGQTLPVLERSPKRPIAAPKEVDIGDAS